MRISTKNIIADEHGEIMLEASIIMVAVLILLMALLSITFMFYQQAVMTSVATEIAEEVAKNLKFTDLAIGSTTLTAEQYEKTQMFRSNFGKDNLEKAKRARADAYSTDRLALASFGLNPGTLHADVKLMVSGIGRMYAKVTVSQTSEFFLSGVLEMLGIADKETMFSATTYAECTDMIGYSSMVNFTDYATDKLSVFESFGDFYVSVKNFITTLMDS